MLAAFIASLSYQSVVFYAMSTVVVHLETLKDSDKYSFFHMKDFYQFYVFIEISSYFINIIALILVLMIISTYNLVTSKKISRSRA